MATIPIELDKLFTTVPAKPVATESLVEQTNLFRRHLEQRRPASEPSSAPATSAGNSRVPEIGSASSASANASQKKNEQKTDSPAEPEQDELAVNRGDGDSTVVAAAVASQPVVDADHAEETAEELQAEAEAAVVAVQKTHAGISANGAAVVAANVITTDKAIVPGKNHAKAIGATIPNESGTVEAHGSQVDASAVANHLSETTVPSETLTDENKTKTAAVHARAAKESQEKGKVATRTKSSGENGERTNEHAAAQTADSDSQSPEEKPQDRSRTDGRSSPHEPNASIGEPTAKTNLPDTKSVARDAAAAAASVDPSTARETVGNSASQNSPTTTNVTDVTATVRLPSHLLSRGAERTASGVHLTDAEQAKFLQRVARAFQAAQERDGEVRLRLSPPELGSLRVEIKIHEGALTARLEAESPAAKALLLDNLPVLRERLAEQGIRIEHFDVDLLDRQPGGAAQNSPQGQERDAPPALPSPLVRKSSETETGESAARLPIRRLGDGRLNVIV